MKNPASYLVLSVLLCGGCGRMPPAAPAPGVAIPGPLSHEAVEAPQARRAPRICVLKSGRLEEVPVTYVVSTGDTLHEGKLFREAFPDTVGYAVNKAWYLNNEPIQWGQRRYTKYGLPRVLATSEVRPVTEHLGVTLFAEVTEPGLPGILYVPTGTGCEFHPYQWDLMTGGVRG